MQHEWHKQDQTALASYLNLTRNKALDFLRQNPPLPLGLAQNSPPSEARMLGQWEAFHATLDALETLALEESAEKPAPADDETTTPEETPNLDKD